MLDFLSTLDGLLMCKATIRFYEWRINSMNYKQLELFDLKPYTTNKPVCKERILINSVSRLDIKGISKPIKYKQLELDLFSQKSNLVEVEFLELAA